MPLPELARLPALDLAVLGVTAGSVAVVLAAVAADHLLVRGRGRVEARVRSPIATASMLAFFAAVLVLLRLRVGQLALPPGPRAALMIAGAGLLAAGAAVNVVGRLQLGRNWADQVTLYRDQALIQRGAYGLVRHPLYAGLIWMFVGGALVHGSWAVLLATLALFVPAMALRARQEERLLEARFPAYAAYRAQVGMLLPRLRGGRGR